MPFLEWTDNLSVGVGLIDEDHQVLIDLINQLHDAVDSEYEREIVGGVLNTLVDYTVYHFKREEAVMAACGYPEQESHLVQHGNMVRGVLEMDRRFRNETDSVIGSDILAFLRTWLTQHIKGQDTELLPFVEIKPEAINAAESVPRIQATGHGLAEGPVSLNADAVADLNVLVVHPSEEFRQLVATILFSAGIDEVVEAETPKEALECLSKEQPDIVFYDWRYAGMDCVEFSRKLRSGVGADTALVMFFGGGNNSLRERALKAGADVLLPQPLTARSVLMALARQVDH